MFDPTEVKATPEQVKEFFSNPLWEVFYARLYQQWKANSSINFCNRGNIDHTQGFIAGLLFAMMIKDDMLSDAINWADAKIQEKMEEEKNA